MWSVFIYAFRRGGWEEKLTLASVTISAYLSVLLPNPNVPRFQQIEIQLACVDAALFVILQLIAFRSKKYWPLWVVAMQGMTLLAHLTPLMPNMLASTYYNAEALWSYPTLILLTFGVRNHHRARTFSHLATN